MVAARGYGGTLNADRVEFRGARMLRAPVYQAAPDQIDEPFAWPGSARST